MTGLTAPFLKRGMMNRIEQSLLRRAMRIMTAQAGCARGIHVVMDITKTCSLAIVTGETEFCRIHRQKALGCPAMGGMAKATILASRGMGHPFLPIFLDILMTAQTELWFLFHQKLLFSGTMGDMTDAAVHRRRRRVHKFSRLNHLGNTLMTGETNLSFRLAQNKRVIAGMGDMTGLALTLDKGWMTMLLGLLLARVFVTAQTEFASADGLL